MRVFVIDRESSTLNEIETIVHQKIGADVFGYENPLIALNEINALEPELVLIDASLESMNAFELAYRIQKNLANVRIVFLTRFHEEVAEVFEDYGIDYLLKPLNPIRLNHILVRTMTQKPKAVEFESGKVSLKLFGAMELKLNAHNIKLTRRRYKEILSYLVLHESTASEDELISKLFTDINPKEARFNLRSHIYLMRLELLPYEESIRLDYEKGKYRLILNQVQSDYGIFLKAHMTDPTSEQLQNVIHDYGRGLLSQWNYDWAYPHQVIAQKQFIHLNQMLIERLLANRDFDKLKEVIFNLKPYLEDKQHLEEVGQLLREHYTPSVYEYFMQD